MNLWLCNHFWFAQIRSKSMCLSHLLNLPDFLQLCFLLGFFLFKSFRNRCSRSYWVLEKLLCTLAQFRFLTHYFLYFFFFKISLLSKHPFFCWTRSLKQACYNFLLFFSNRPCAWTFIRLCLILLWSWCRHWTLFV